jgi:hypothetical protein
MNTIIGTGRTGNLFLKFIVWILLLTSCHPAVNTNNENMEARARVKIAKIAYRNLEQSINIIATTKYIDKGIITSPASGYITTFYAQPGSLVRKGQKLLSLETKEHRAMHQDSSINKNPLSDLGQFSVYAPADGFVTDLLHAYGDYVQDGASLGTFVHSNRLVFQAYIPFVYNKLAKTGMHCTLILPDSTVISAVFSRLLNTVDVSSQSVLVLIIPDKSIFLPEGLNAALKITTGHVSNTQVLPESALLSDETLRNYWIMKLINDSVSIKIPVKPGMHQGIWVQVENPVFSPTDRFIVEGNYGLSDTAKVEVEK